jgi:hypothetical protein
MSVRRLLVTPLGVLCLLGAFSGSVQALPTVADTATSAPSVQTMVVGSGGTILFQARTVTAASTTVQAGRRSCAVDAGTPLAALAALRRAGGPGFALRDYGRCGSSPVNSGELFVYSLGGEVNSGQSGWEYKVDGLSGSTGAADPSGPQGNGRRLSSGERLLWFWCQASSGGCERTLEVSSSAGSISAGHALTVTVEGYDNEGRGLPVAGAIVTLGSDFASTAANGRATLIAPATHGSYQLSAIRHGLVPSFPETIVVK